MSAGNMQMSLK